MNTTKNVGYPSFYRFNDFVAVCPPRGNGGNTFYLSAHEARSIGEYLLRAADDISKTRFVDSVLPEFGISDQARDL